MIEIPVTARGLIRPATEQEIEKENGLFYLATDTGLMLMTDSNNLLVPNIDELGYTNPNLHRRVDQDPDIPVGSDYPFVYYDSEGVPYKQNVVIGVWDGVNSYRTTTTFTHDEESTTCEIP